MNVFSMTGFLGDNARIETNDANHYLFFKVADNQGKDKEGKDKEPMWVSVFYYGKKDYLDKLKAMLVKGTEVFVSGSLSVSIKKKEENSFLNCSLSANLLHVCGSKKSNEKSE